MATEHADKKAEAAQHDEYEDADRTCCDCGAPLAAEEMACGRDLCFDCYCFHQG
jgi:hypothetical protein